MDTLDHLSSPVLDAKRIPVAALPALSKSQISFMASLIIKKIIFLSLFFVMLSFVIQMHVNLYLICGL